MSSNLKEKTTTTKKDTSSLPPPNPHIQATGTKTASVLNFNQSSTAEQFLRPTVIHKLLNHPHTLSDREAEELHWL